MTPVFIYYKAKNFEFNMKHLITKVLTPKKENNNNKDITLFNPQMSLLILRMPA